MERVPRTVCSSLDLFQSIAVVLCGVRWFADIDTSGTTFNSWVPAMTTDLFDAPRLAFLGAGASKQFGKMLMTEFVQSLLKETPPDHDLLKCICEKTPDLEFLMEELESLKSKEYLQSYVSMTPVSASPRPPLRYASDRLLKWVKARVFDHYRELKPEGLFETYMAEFDELLEVLRPSKGPIVIFTTNYDPVVEQLCLIKDWILVDGFKNDPKAGEYRWSRDAFDIRDTNSSEKTIILFKLHGSTNWIRQGGRVLKSASLYAADDRMCENMMIFPLTKKVAIEDPYFTAYYYLGRCLEKAELCLVIGYSFRDYDTITRFKAGRISNPRLRILILDPQAKELVEHLQRNGIESEPLPFKFGFKPELYLNVIESLIHGKM